MKKVKKKFFPSYAGEEPRAQCFIIKLYVLISYTPLRNFNCKLLGKIFDSLTYLSLGSSVILRLRIQ